MPQEPGGPEFLRQRWKAFLQGPCPTWLLRRPKQHAGPSCVPLRRHGEGLSSSHQQQKRGWKREKKKESRAAAVSVVALASAIGITTFTSDEMKHQSAAPGGGGGGVGGGRGREPPQANVDTPCPLSPCYALFVYINCATHIG